MADTVRGGWERLPVVVTTLAPSNGRPVLVERDDTTGVDVYRIAGALTGPHVVVLAGERTDPSVPSAHSLVEAGFVLRGGNLSIVSLVGAHLPGAEVAPDSAYGRLMADADVVIDLHHSATQSPASDGPVDAAAGTADVARTLRDLGMLEAPTTDSDRRPTQLAAHHTGWFVDLCSPGTRVVAGDLIGAVTDRSGSILQRVEAVHDGMVVLIRRGSQVDAGDRLVMLTRVAGC